MDEKAILTRLIFILCIIIGAASALYSILTGSGFGWDFKILYVAAEVSMNGKQFIGNDLLGPSFDSPYIYPPISVVYFYPYTILDDWEMAFIIHSFLKLILAFVVSLITFRQIRAQVSSVTRFDFALLLGMFALSAPSVTSFTTGGMDFHLIIGLVLMYVFFDSRHRSFGGLAFGATTALKGWPALLGFYFLRRNGLAFTIIGASAALFLSLLGILLFGVDSLVNYLIAVTEFRSHVFAGGVTPPSPTISLRRPISALLPNIDPTWYSVICVIILLPYLIYLYFGLDFKSYRGQISGYLGSIAAIIMFLQSTNYYVLYAYFPLFVLLYIVENKNTHRLLLLGLIFIQMIHFYTIFTLSINLLPIGSDAKVLFFGLIESVLQIVSVPLVGMFLISLALLIQTRKPTPVADRY